MVQFLTCLGSGKDNIRCLLICLEIQLNTTIAKHYVLYVIYYILIYCILKSRTHKLEDATLLLRS